MSPTFGIPQAGQSLQTAWNRIGKKVDELSAQVESGDVSGGSLVKTVVELKTLELQAKVAGALFRTLDEMATDLLGRPRK